MKVFITSSIRECGIKILKENFSDVEIWESDEKCPKEIILKKASECDAILTQCFDPIDADVLNHPNLKIVSQAAVGLDNIDLEFATNHKIVVAHTPGVLTESCADFAWCLLLAISRQLCSSVEYVRNGQWIVNEPQLFNGFDISGKTLGIIGPGRIGQSIANRAKGFSMQILYHGPHQKPAFDNTGAKYCSEIDDLLSKSDFVVISASLNSSTKGLINIDKLKKMKRTSILVNIARGPIVVTEDLYKALNEGIISGAAVDVIDPEPIPKEHSLLKLNNFIICPHMADATIETRDKISAIAAKAIVDALNGRKVEFCANPNVYD
ncbi:D-glycerate dehydrogenase [Histomonas meleagridis]|uniref:D-glycerate dehydrogenase n=1 Tax=Histomonas meleagridis TaxID=135588 RepID=UPI00355A232C|nr:D-glycerate dehydrogenase [Histomonas meleagridis]KAH0803193.1 D-glycerate dehydrogenase [Histomonas meleagridis]